jgi:hypothetical protein
MPIIPIERSATRLARYGIGARFESARCSVARIFPPQRRSELSELPAVSIALRKQREGGELDDNRFGRVDARPDLLPWRFARKHESVDGSAHLGRKIAGRRKDGFVLVYRLEQSEAAAFDDVQELAQKRLMVRLA